MLVLIYGLRKSIEHDNPTVIFYLCDMLKDNIASTEGSLKESVQNSMLWYGGIIFD